MSKKRLKSAVKILAVLGLVALFVKELPGLRRELKIARM
jgi:hypothetical protein